MPKQKPGRSKQDYQTPPEFITAVKSRLHIDEFGMDLAATKDNAVCEHFLSEGEDDALNPSMQWDYDGWCWCNPPYSKIEDWVSKAAEEAQRGAHIAMLVPASVGSNWWRDYVDKHAHVLFLNGRLTFGGCDAPYPKDTALLLYTPWKATGNQIWDWQHEHTLHYQM